jgi:hypothetical protein
MRTSLENITIYCLLAMITLVAYIDMLIITQA